MDAFTSKEYTCFYAKVLDEHLDGRGRSPGRHRAAPARSTRRSSSASARSSSKRSGWSRTRRTSWSTTCSPTHVLPRPPARAADPGHARARSRRSARRAAAGASSARPTGRENMLIVAAGNLQHDALARLVAAAPSARSRAAAQRRTAAATARRGRSAAIVQRARKRARAAAPAARAAGLPRALRAALPALRAEHDPRRDDVVAPVPAIREERGLAYTVYSALELVPRHRPARDLRRDEPGRGDARSCASCSQELRDAARQGPDREPSSRSRKEHLKGSLMLSLESTGEPHVEPGAAGDLLRPPARPRARRSAASSA